MSNRKPRKGNENRHLFITKNQEAYWDAEHKNLHPHTSPANCPICSEIARRNREWAAKLERQKQIDYNHQNAERFWRNVKKMDTDD